MVGYIDTWCSLTCVNIIQRCGYSIQPPEEAQPVHPLALWAQPVLVSRDVQRRVHLPCRPRRHLSLLPLTTREQEEREETRKGKKVRRRKKEEKKKERKTGIWLCGKGETDVYCYFMRGRVNTVSVSNLISVSTHGFRTQQKITMFTRGHYYQNISFFGWCCLSVMQQQLSALLNSLNVLVVRTAAENTSRLALPSLL